VADTTDESEDIIFAHGFGTITDLEVGPDDGYLYVVSLVHGAIYRIFPVDNSNDINGPSVAEEREEEEEDDSGANKNN
jgi:hypothetical protein